MLKKALLPGCCALLLAGAVGTPSAIAEPAQFLDVGCREISPTTCRTGNGAIIHFQPEQVQSRENAMDTNWCNLTKLDQATGVTTSTTAFCKPKAVVFLTIRIAPGLADIHIK